MRLGRFILLLFFVHLSFLASAQTGTTNKDTLALIEGFTAIDPVEQNAEFPGGKNAMRSFFKNNIVYPTSAIKDKVSGRVFCRFVIKKNGKVKRVKIVKGIREDLNNEALRVLKLMPEWKPCRMFGGKVSKQQLAIPIVFTLPE